MIIDWRKRVKWNDEEAEREREREEVDWMELRERTYYAYSLISLFFGARGVKMVKYWNGFVTLWFCNSLAGSLAHSLTILSLSLSLSCFTHSAGFTNTPTSLDRQGSPASHLFSNHYGFSLSGFFFFTLLVNILKIYLVGNKFINTYI